MALIFMDPLDAYEERNDLVPRFLAHTGRIDKSLQGIGGRTSISLRATSAAFGVAFEPVEREETLHVAFDYFLGEDALGRSHSVVRFMGTGASMDASNNTTAAGSRSLAGIRYESGILQFYRVTGGSSNSHTVVGTHEMQGGGPARIEMSVRRVQGTDDARMVAYVDGILALDYTGPWSSGLWSGDFPVALIAFGGAEVSATGPRVVSYSHVIVWSDRDTGDGLTQFPLGDVSMTTIAAEALELKTNDGDESFLTLPGTFGFEPTELPGEAILAQTTAFLRADGTTNRNATMEIKSGASTTGAKPIVVTALPDYVAYESAALPLTSEQVADLQIVFEITDGGD